MEKYCYTSHSWGEFPRVINHKGKPLTLPDRYHSYDLVYHNYDHCGKIYLDKSTIIEEEE